jgi:hypothetical protein
MEPAGEGLALRVELSEATAWPVTVDPLLGVAAWFWESNIADARAGWDAHGAGDVNGDGYADVILGAPSWSDGEAGEGAAYAFYGGPAGLGTTPDWFIEGDLADRGLGLAVATAGDVNCDGYADVIVGAGMPDPNASPFGQGEALVYHGGPSGLSTTAAWSTVGTAAGAGYGYKVASAGDVDGDGCADVIVGEPQLASNAGSVSVFYGDPAGLPTVADWTYGPGGEGCVAPDRCGFDVASAGDLNGDGYSDVAFTSYTYDAPVGGGINRGAALVFHGSAAGLEADYASLVFPPLSGAYGISLASAGDVDGDGYSDLIVGGSRTDSPLSTALSEGAAFVYYGSAAGITVAGGDYDWAGWGLGHAHYYGRSVAGVGDLNGDGYGDVAIGGHTWNIVDVLFGSAAGLPLSTDATVLSGPSQATYSGFGQVVGPAGDVNGDGLADLIVGAYQRGNPELLEGGAFIYYGSAHPSADADWSTSGATAGDELGFAVAAAGDVDGDGYADFAVGAPHATDTTSDEGVVYLFSGAPDGLSSTASWVGSEGQTGAEYGAAVASAGDVDGDGYADLVVGAPGWDSDQGRAFVYLGSAIGLSVAADAELASTQAGARFGASVAPAGDVDRDGHGAVLVGAPSWDVATGDEGRVDLFEGGAAGLSQDASWTIEGGAGGDAMGSAVAGAGDVDGDGYSDVLVGAPGFDGSAADQGRVELYSGSPSGLSGLPGWAAEGGQPDAALGTAVAGVGDLNGDGYADVAAGAPGLNDGLAGEGVVQVWLGGSSGPSASPDWSEAGGQEGAGFSSVATGGDVNGDGYADLLAGTADWDGSQPNSGGAWLYLGGDSGPASAGVWAYAPDQADGAFGSSLALAGDVDGDGLSDLLVGAPGLDGASGGEGGALLFRGGGLDGGVAWDLHPQATQASTLVPIAPGGRLATPDAFDVTVVARSSAGPTRVKLQIEVKPLGAPFDGVADVESALWTFAGSAGVTLTESVTGLALETGYHWRARILFHPADPVQQIASRWLWGGAPGHPEGVHLRSGCAADLDSDGACNSFDPDLDGDGFFGGNDCDEGDPAIHPDADEFCNGLDDDCNGGPDDGLVFVDYWIDADVDGFGDSLAIPTSACLPVAGSVTNADDCDDSTSAVAPGELEVVGDGVDQDCNGVDAIECQEDLDGDGYGTVETVVEYEDLDCADDPGQSANAADCDDSDPTIHPSAAETCDAIDSDCDDDLVDGDLDTDGDDEPDCIDLDDDGDGEPDASDCGPQEASIHPGAADPADDGVDQDCNGVDTITCFEDLDGDDYGSSNTVLESEDADCDDDAGQSSLSTDCDDGDTAFHPGADELCDELDTDCDGMDDAGGFDGSETDDDGDGQSECQGDCDDDDATTWLGGVEVCDEGVDNDCDPATSELADEDGDGSTPCSGDCDDSDAEVAGHLAEVCDGKDNDCDPETDEDADSDGDGWSICGGDCGEGDPDRYPGADELCDELDTDCDGDVPVEETEDSDGDGSVLCLDCDDDDPDAYPDAEELCDELDSDCDGDLVDQFEDLDGDGLPECDEGDDDDSAVDPLAGYVMPPGCEADCTAGLAGRSSAAGWLLLGALLLGVPLVRRRRAGRSAALLLGIGLLVPSAASAGDPGGDPAVDAAAEAFAVHQEHCSTVAGGGEASAVGSMIPVTAAWQRVLEAFDETGETYLLYWRGVLAECMDHEDRAEEDLLVFVGLAAEDRALKPQIADARRRLRRMGVRAPEPDPEALAEARARAEQAERTTAETPAEALRAAASAKRGQRLSIGLGGGYQRTAAFDYGLVALDLSVGIVGPLRVDAGLRLGISGPPVNGYGEPDPSRRSVLAAVVLGPVVVFDLPVRPRLGALFQLAPNPAGSVGPSTLVGAAGLAGVEIPFGRSPLAFRTSVELGVLGPLFTVRASGQLVVGFGKM